MRHFPVHAADDAGKIIQEVAHFIGVVEHEAVIVADEFRAQFDAPEQAAVPEWVNRLMVGYF